MTTEPGLNFISAFPTSKQLQTADSIFQSGYSIHPPHQKESDKEPDY